MVPVLNLSAFFLRLSKDTKPNFRITKYNATTLTVLVFGAFLAQSPIDKAAIVAEEKYRYVEILIGTVDLALNLLKSSKNNSEEI